eukprot:747535-Hanusia_phi.AAC.2
MGHMGGTGKEGSWRDRGVAGHGVRSRKSERVVIKSRCHPVSKVAGLEEGLVVGERDGWGGGYGGRFLVSHSGRGGSILA